MIATLTLNPSVDTGTVVDQVVAGRKLRCDPPRSEPGGGGINVSRAVRRLGGSSTALFTAGGRRGDLFLSLIEAEGIERRVVPLRGETRENLVVLERSSGRQYRLGMPGPEVEETEWRAVLEELERLDPPPAWLVLSGSLPPGVPEDFYLRAGRVARGKGARVVLDTSGGPLLRAVEEGVYLVKPNLREFVRLAGLDPGSGVEEEGRLREAARRVVGSGACRVLAVSLGARGLLLVGEGEDGYLDAPTVPVRSRIGAGDSTVAGLTLKLAQGWELREAASFGVAAGAAAVMTPGTELCRREDAERLYRGMGG